MALACAAVVPTMGRAMLVLNLALITWVLFGGFLVRKSSIPWALQWLSYLRCVDSARAPTPRAMYCL